MIKEALAAAGILHGEAFQLASILDRDIRCATFRRRRPAARWARAQKGRNVYICGNPVLYSLGRRRAGAAHVTRANCLLVDADPDPDGDCLGLLAKVRDYVGGVLVDSGRGAQLWLQVEAGVDRAGLLRAIASKFKTPGVKFDATHDPARLQRLPGTVNLKTGRLARFA